MSAKPNPSTWLRKLQQYWGVLMQGAIWVSGIIGSFLLPPPADILEDENKSWLRLAQFVIAVIVGLLFVATRKWKNKKHAKGWGMLSASLLILSVTAFAGYQYLLFSWTCTYNRQRVVIGTEFTPQGKYYVSQNPGGISCDELIADFAGNVEDIWTRRTINRARLVLGGAYISCMPLFTGCLIGVIQAIQVGEKRQMVRKQ